MKSILDPSFKYVPAAKSDIAKTFKRILDRQRKEKRDRVLSEATPRTVVMIAGRK